MEREAEGRRAKKRVGGGDGEGECWNNAGT